jgi:DNA polymerase-1
MKKKPPYTHKYILLDAHAIIHRAYHALPDFTTRSGAPTGALYGLMTMLVKVITDLNPDYIIACYDLPGKTFRHTAYEEYKGTRKKIDDVLIEQLKKSREIFEAFNIPIYDYPGFEADDILGTLAELLKKDKSNQIIIASGDMDTMQLIDGDQVLVYTLKKGITDTILYDEKAVKERYGFSPEHISDYKGLRGDTSDNIIGIKGIGEKTATTIIERFGSIEALYKALKKNPTQVKDDIKVTDRIINLLIEGEDEALFSKELATIRRDAPVTFIQPPIHSSVYNPEAVEKLCLAYEFKSLGPRMRSLYSKDTPAPTIKNNKEKVVLEESEEDDTIVDPKYLLALSLLDSENLHPTKAEVLSFSSDGTYEDAYKHIEAQLTKEGMYTLWSELEVPLFPIVEEMSQNGILVDLEYFKKMSEVYHRELSKLEKTIWQLVGQEFNINSPKQLGEILFTVLKLNDQDGTKTKIKKTTTGVLSTKESELEKLRGKHPVVDHLFEYRELQKLLSTYIDVLPSLVAPDGRIHSTFNQLGAATGRFSSNDPNLQNIPIKTEKGKAIRGGFISAPGYTFIGCDYSQIELRIAALLSQDANLLQTFIEGKDIHTSVASRVFHVEERDVTSEMRRRSKVINFGILYGMGATALSQNLGLPRKDAQVFLEEYKASYPTLAVYLDESLKFAQKNKYSVTLFGRKRNFKKITSPLPFIRAMYERMAVNAPVQGTAADVIKRAMVSVADALREKKLQDAVRLVLQIHDEIIFEVKDEKLTEATELIISAMEGVLASPVTKGMQIPPLEVHVSTAKTWAELK